jgi:hypothetical protein
MIQWTVTEAPPHAVGAETSRASDYNQANVIAQIEGIE